METEPELNDVVIEINNLPEPSKKIKKTKPKNSGTPVKRKKTAVTRSCLISRRKAT